MAVNNSVCGSLQEDQRTAEQMEHRLSVMAEQSRNERENQKIIDGSLEREENERESIKGLLSGMIKRSETD